MPHMHQHSAEMKQCIDNCMNCHRTCLETMQHCITMGGKHTEPAHLRLMADCVEICQTSANFMIRMSDLHKLTCGVCAEICQRCGDDCAKMSDDAHMKACAEMCHKCAKTCKAMAS